MTEGTTLRLDTADVALELGWDVESMEHGDQFRKANVIIDVAYSADDDLAKVARSGENRDHELDGRSPTERHELIRAWLAGRTLPAAARRRRASPKPSSAPKLRWSRENWLHKPTQEVVDNSDPRVPRRNEDARSARAIWYLAGSQANVDGGYYRREMDMATTAAQTPMYTATWHPLNGPVVVLVRGTTGDAYWACVRHHQAKYT